VKIVIAGSRGYTNYEQASTYLNACFQRLGLPKEDITIISGACRGADSLGERFAVENGIQLIRVPADWRIYGKGAGPKRNRTMVDMCDYIICFWDGKSAGTESLIEYARQKNKPVMIQYI